MDGPTFDELTKTLRAASTRRQAAGGLLGFGLAALTGHAVADAKAKRHAKHKHTDKGKRGADGPGGKGGNSACAHFCAAVFGADTPAAGQCTSDAAHGKGLCHQCGAANAGQVCCVQSNGVCPDYASAQCCSGKDTCGGGNPGTPGVCGCTRQCTGKNCGDDDTCGGKCDGPCSDECQTCDGGVCKPRDDGTPCGSGVRCCKGKCPPSVTCTVGCCDASADCQANCCADCCSGSHWRGFAPGFCDYTDHNVCLSLSPGAACTVDQACGGNKYGTGICICGSCCLTTGSPCDSNDDCCSKVCGDDGNCK